MCFRIASQLPENKAEALLVLDYARHMVVEYFPSGVADNVRRASGTIETPLLAPSRVREKVYSLPIALRLPPQPVPRTRPRRLGSRAGIACGSSFHCRPKPGAIVIGFSSPIGNPQVADRNSARRIDLPERESGAHSLRAPASSWRRRLASESGAASLDAGLFAALDLLAKRNIHFGVEIWMAALQYFIQVEDDFSCPYGADHCGCVLACESVGEQYKRSAVGSGLFDRTPYATRAAARTTPPGNSRAAQPRERKWDAGARGSANDGGCGGA